MNKKPLKKNNTTAAGPKKQTPAKKKIINFDAGKWQKIANFGALGIFILTAIYYLPVTNKNILFKIQDLSIFLPTEFFFSDQMKVPGGLLSWMGNFLTQFFYYPWLGSILFIVAALLVQYLAIRAFRIPSRFYLFTFAIPFALVLGITQLGYMIFAIKLQGYVYVMALGFAVSLAALWGYRKVAPVAVRSVLAVLFIAAFYPLAGFYALLAGALFCLTEIRAFLKDRQKSRIIPVLAIIAVGLIAPQLWYSWHFTQIDAPRIYTAGLPILFEPEQFCRIPYAGIFATLLIIWLLSFAEGTKPAKLITLAGGIVVYALAFYGLVRYSYNDENFQTEVAMDLALFDNRWEDVVKLAKQQKDEPTRLIVMQTNLALQKLGRGGDEMFTYKNGNKEMKSPWPIRLVAHSGKSLYFHYGKINYSYHWCMEDLSERGPKIEDLRYMVKYALMKKELKLAQRYNDLLKKTLFYKGWAEKYQRYIDNPNLMAQDAEFRSLNQLTNFEDELFDDNGILELYLLNIFPQTESRSPEMLEIAIQNALIMRSSNLFWPKFHEFVRTQKRIPRHYQEAALMFSYFERKVDVSNIQFDTAVLEKFSKLVNMCEQNVGNPKEVNSRIFATPFGDSYWHYFFFGKKLNTR